MENISTSELFIKLAVLTVLLVLSLIIGRQTDKLVKLLLFRFRKSRREQIYKIYDQVIEPVKPLVNNLSTLVLCYASILWFTYSFEPGTELRTSFYRFAILILDPITYILFFSSVSRLFHRLIRGFGISLILQVGHQDAAEFLLAIEIFFNIILWTLAFAIFGITHNIPLTGVLAGVSIGGLAISFAAQNTLSQLLGTIILFLDRPFITNEHIRLPDGTLGKVESIGLRSTKIRIVAKGTLLIVPNSKMADWQIENITRGRKVMMLNHMDFDRVLEEYEEALVRQVITRHINSFYGIESGTASVDFFRGVEQEFSRARVIFFILGSTESSIDLRRRLVSMTDNAIASELESNNITYVSNEPIVSFDSPVPI